MKLGNPKSILVITTLLLVVYSGFGFSLPHFTVAEIPENYVDVVSYSKGFIAITNEGRIDWISEKGDITQTRRIEGETVSNLIANGQQVIASGIRGQIFCIENDETIKKVACNTTKEVNCMVQFRNKIIAGCNNGELQIGDSKTQFETIHLDLNGNIVSLSSENSVCYGVTDEGEIIHSTDGQSWTIFNFNEIYKGYYKTCSFKKVLSTPKQITVLGINKDGFPVLFFSSKGNVWTERPLIYSDEEGFNTQLTDIPNDIYFDAAKDQFILLCSDGKLMTIPSCSHCQKLYKISDEKLNSISGSENDIILVGDNNYIKIINGDLL